MTHSPEQLAAELYDASVPDWDGELVFYREFFPGAREQAQPVLEIACGTGRLTLSLARLGIPMVGMDLDEEMLAIAHRKSQDVPNVRWIKGDMRTLDLGETFGLILVPGHSFQFMCTPDDQVRALEAFKRHLGPGGTLILHLDSQNVGWLGDLLRERGGTYEQGREVVHPQTGHVIRKASAWTYEPSTQTATVTSRWQELGEDGSILQTWERKPMALHCIFPFEMEHLLARTGFVDRVVYGDFFKNPLSETSPEMIWVVRKP